MNSPSNQKKNKKAKRKGKGKASENDAKPEKPYDLVQAIDGAALTLNDLREGKEGEAKEGEAKEGKKMITSTVQAETSVDIQGLIPGKKYFFRLAGSLTVERRKGPETLHFVCCEDVEIGCPAARPNAPAIPTGSATKSSLKMKWKAPEHPNGSPIEEYKLEVQQAGSALGFTEKYSGELREYSMVDLLPGSAFSFRVSAKNEIGWSPWSDIAHASTGAGVPLPSVAPSLVVSSPASLTVRWPPLPDALTNGAPVIGYSVEISKGGNADSNDEWGDFYPEHDGDARTVQCVVKRLNPNCRYRLRLAASNKVGRSQFSNVLECLTVASAPAAPSPPRLQTTKGATGAGADAAAMAVPGMEGGDVPMQHLKVRQIPPPTMPFTHPPTPSPCPPPPPPNHAFHPPLPVPCSCFPASSLSHRGIFVALCSPSA
jgi:hypothetical protein